MSLVKSCTVKLLKIYASHDPTQSKLSKDFSEKFKSHCVCILKANLEKTKTKNTINQTTFN